MGSYICQLFGIYNYIIITINISVTISTLKLIFGLFNSTCIVEISMETFIENIFNFGVSNNEEIQEELSFILNPGRTR